MRALPLCAIYLLLTCAAAAAPETGGSTGLSGEELSANHERDRWRGRQHYLFDRDNRSETTGVSPFDPRECRKVPTRIRRSDGSLAVQRLDKCD